MDEQEFKEYISAQIEEINKHKWIQSKAAGHDLGDAAVKDWILKYAKQFREFWENRKQK